MRWLMGHTTYPIHDVGAPTKGPLCMFNGQERILFSLMSSFTISDLLPLLRHHVRGNDSTTDFLSSSTPTLCHPRCHTSDLHVVPCQIQMAAPDPMFRLTCVVASSLHTFLLGKKFLGEVQGTTSGDEGQVLVLTNLSSPLSFDMEMRKNNSIKFLQGFMLIAYYSLGPMVILPGSSSPQSIC